MIPKGRYIFFILFLILVGTGMAQEIEVTLQEVIDLVNFSREIIEDGELNVIYLQSPDKSALLTKHDAVRLADMELEQWKQEYALGGEANIQIAKAYRDGHIRYLTDGKVTYEEQNIAFRVKPDADSTNPHDSMLYRLYCVDRFDQYANESPRNNRYLTERMPLLIDYHDLLIVNREYAVNLRCSAQVSHGSIEAATPSRIRTPFNLIGRLYSPTLIKDIVAHGWEETEAGRCFTMTCEPPLPDDMKTHEKRYGRISGKAWLHPKFDFCVWREEYYLHRGKNKFKVSETTYSGYQQFSDGIWFPTKIEGREYSHIKPRVIQYHFAYIVREAAFNLGLPLDFFDLGVKEVLSTGIEIMPYTR